MLIKDVLHQYNSMLRCTHLQELILMALTSYPHGRSQPPWQLAKTRVQLEMPALLPKKWPQVPSKYLAWHPSGTSKMLNRNCNSTISWLGTSASPTGGAMLLVGGRLAAALVVAAPTWLICSVRPAPVRDLARPAFKGNKKRKRSKCSMMNRIPEQKLCRWDTRKCGLIPCQMSLWLIY